MSPTFYASASLARILTPRRILRQCLQFSDFRSAYSLDKVYPQNSLDITKPQQAPVTKALEFSGYIPVDQLEISYIQSTDVGGKHVKKNNLEITHGKLIGPERRILNTVNTKVDVRFHLSKAKWLSEEIKAKILQKHKNDLNKEGFVIIQSDKTRVQMLNLADCLDKIRELIHDVINPPKPPVINIEENSFAFSQADLLTYETTIMERHDKAARDLLRIKKVNPSTKQDRQAQIVD